jgi:exo-beta-1,3-glucanase (GH17 family)/cellulose synthase/poly-beta-1,6-N-acetylglucosamine synthase-like glycosyltransferase
MSRTNIIIALVIAALTISFWALLNRPEIEPPWPEVIQGFSFSPMGVQHDPAKGIYPTVEEIDADLALLQGRTHAVRTYTVEGAQGEIPKLARQYGINVALGAWIDERVAKNQVELEQVIKIANENRRNVVRVIVGNEVILRKDLPPKQLIKYLDKVRKALGVPVSTAEPWHIWLKYPNLVDHVDYLAVHMLPYWEGVPIDKSVDYIVDRFNQLKERFPDKPIVIAEVGWPSNGRTREGAVASLANQAVFLRRFIERARQERYIYYVMEAFDQLWKAQNEGSVGSYWGVYNVERKPKFNFKEPIVEIPQWHVLAAISVLIAAITFSLLLIDSKTLTHRGRGFLAIIAYVAATAAVWIVYSYIQQYLSISAIIVGILMLLGMIGVIIVLLVEAHEWAEAQWVKARRRGFTPVTVAGDELPMVSIHLPAYNEPPDMLIETLDALTRLDYPNFEVLVIDNNTKDPAVWEPVEKHCQKLGERFRFFHVAPLSGFKSGALNFALRHTAPQAQVIAVIDSDYQVNPDWLKDLTPQFQNPKIAVVQAPQDYRDAGENAFKAMCYAEYRGFFYIGMVTRNERNAIIQHGTMTMVRREVLEAVGNWSEESITEDAELGLRIFEHGYEATYIAKSYGKGLIPDTFLNYKNQRFRWAYGAMTIMRSHARALFGRACEHLSIGQRYHFIAGWLPWIADSINLIFNFAALSWSLGMILAPKHVDPPLIIFSALPLALFLFKVSKMIYLYRGVNVVGTTRQTLAAALSGLALSHTIAKAILQGAVTRNKPFLRTPKLASSAALLQAINDAREETLLLVALWLSAWGIAHIHGTASMDLLLWVSVLLVQSIPYVASLLMSVISGFPGLRAELIASSSTLDKLEAKTNT